VSGGTAGAGCGVAGAGGVGAGDAARWRYSDVNLKQDIVQVGTMENGIGLYRFSYKGDDHTAYVGVMAQEGQTVMPTAVARGSNGYLLVNYDRLGFQMMTWEQWLAQSGVKQPVQ
jgi:hypothetical protein